MKMEMNVEFGNKVSKFFKASPVSGISVVELPENGCRCVKVQSDITLLMQQEKLKDKIGVDAVRAWLDSLGSDKAGFDTSSISDTDLLRFVKPRTLQTGSEMRNWSQYLKDNQDELLRQLKSQSYYNDYKKRETERMKKEAERSAAFDKFVASQNAKNN